MVEIMVIGHRVIVSQQSRDRGLSADFTGWILMNGQDRRGDADSRFRLSSFWGRRNQVSDGSALWNAQKGPYFRLTFGI